MFFYLYEIKNNINNKIYVGVHKTSNLEDGYMGSGKIIKNAIKKYGIQNFTKRIIESFSSEEEIPENVDDLLDFFIELGEEIDVNDRTKDELGGRVKSKQKDDVGPSGDFKPTKVRFHAGPKNEETEIEVKKITDESPATVVKTQKPEPRDAEDLKAKEGRGKQGMKEEIDSDLLEALGLKHKLKAAGKSFLSKVGGGSDKDQLKRLQKDMGLPQTGENPVQKEEIEQFDEATLNRLIAIKKNHGLDILIPNLDLEIPCYQRIADDLKSRGIHTLLPTPAATDKLNKQGLIKLAQRNGFSDFDFPNTMLVSSKKELVLSVFARERYSSAISLALVLPERRRDFHSQPFL